MTSKWIYALPFALAAFGVISAAAAGRSPDFSAPSGASEPADSIGTYVYDDARRSHGRERSSAARTADANFCDHGNTENIGSSAFNACMITRGWRFSHFEQAAPGTYAYNDVLRPHGRGRGDGARQAATKVCDHGDSDNIGDDAFNACMLAHGWRFAGSVPQASDSSDSVSDDPSPSTDSGSDAANQAMEMVNEENAVNAANAAATQQFNDAMAAAQQTENNANFIQQ